MGIDKEGDPREQYANWKAPDTASVNDESKLGREIDASPEIQQIAKEQSELRAARDVVNGKQFYAALREKPDNFRNSYKEMFTVDVKASAANLKEYQLRIQKGEKPNPSKEQTLKSELDWRQKVVKEDAFSEADKHMEKVKDDLKDGVLLNTKYGGEKAVIGGIQGGPSTRDRKGRLETGLIDALRNNYSQYRKEFGADAQAEDQNLRMARGVGLAALESGDFDGAEQAFAFTESQSPMDGETRKQFDQLVSKLKPDIAKGFLKELSRRQQDHVKL